jgi:hypothetical protein
MNEILKDVVKDMLKASGLFVLCGLVVWGSCQVLGISDSIGMLLSAIAGGLCVLKN